MNKTTEINRILTSMNEGINKCASQIALYRSMEWDDARQELIVRLLEKVHASYTENSKIPLTAFMWSALHYAYLDVLDLSQRMARTASNTYEEATIPHLDERTMYIFDDIVDQIYIEQFIDRLTPESKRLFKLRASGMSYRDYKRTYKRDMWLLNKKLVNECNQLKSMQYI